MPTKAGSTPGHHQGTSSDSRPSGTATSTDPSLADPSAQHSQTATSQDHQTLGGAKAGSEGKKGPGSGTPGKFREARWPKPSGGDLLGVDERRHIEAGLFPAASSGGTGGSRRLGRMSAWGGAAGVVVIV